MEASKFVAALRIGLSRRDGLLHEKAQCAFPHWAFYAVIRPGRSGGDALFVLAKSLGRRIRLMRQGAPGFRDPIAPLPQNWERGHAQGLRVSPLASSCASSRRRTWAASALRSRDIGQRARFLRLRCPFFPPESKAARVNSCFVAFSSTLATAKFEDDISVARMILVGPLPRPSGPGLQDPLRPGPLCTLNPERFRPE